MSQINVRDVDVNDEVKQLLELGYFTEGFDFYMVGYVKNEQIFCRINENAQALLKFIKLCEENNCTVTTLKHYNKRVKVLSGTIELVKEEIRQEILHDFGRIYQKELLRKLNNFNQTAPNDTAYHLMCQWKAKLMPCFEKMPLKLFLATVKRVYLGKFLTKSSYLLLSRWALRRLEDIDKYEMENFRFQRSFYGFAYLSGGAAEYYVDANELKCYMKSLELENENMAVTPILKQTFEQNSLKNNDVGKMEKMSIKCLQENINEEYLDLFRQINAFATVINEKAFRAMAQSFTLPAERALLKHYGYFWNIKM